MSTFSNWKNAYSSFSTWWRSNINYCNLYTGWIHKALFHSSNACLVTMQPPSDHQAYLNWSVRLLWSVTLLKPPTSLPHESLPLSASANSSMSSIWHRSPIGTRPHSRLGYYFGQSIRIWILRLVSIINPIPRFFETLCSLSHNPSHSFNLSNLESLLHLSQHAGRISLPCVDLHFVNTCHLIQFTTGLLPCVDHGHPFANKPKRIVSSFAINLCKRRPK